jgi:hypothetical protein
LCSNFDPSGADVAIYLDQSPLAPIFRDRRNDTPGAQKGSHE